MNVQKMKELFEDRSDLVYLDFDKVLHKRSEFRDLHAFLVLSELAPSDDGLVVVSAEHDVIYLSADPTRVAEVITVEQVTELVRCGVVFDDAEKCFYMFV